jgi:cell division protein FtsI (penicillin-binding protein 3)
MPDLRGYSKKQLLPLLLREDITVDIQGDGWVKNQDPAPGSPITPGTTIHLDLQ